MHELKLSGLAEPVLAHYLSALGLFRAMATQLDSETTMRFERDGTTILASEALTDDNAWVKWVLQQWRPAPIASPWNSGAGFHGGSKAVPCTDGVKRNGVELLLQTTDSRLADYRKLLSWLQATSKRLGYGNKDGSSKEVLLATLRSEAPELFLPWLDAVAVVEPGVKQGASTLEAKYLSLLGSGGNDGRLDFGNNYMIHLCRMLAFEGNRLKLSKSSAAVSRTLLRSLLGEPTSGMMKDSAGQFVPASRGAPNGDSGLKSDAAEQLVNPWLFIFSLNGALLFAGAATRRLGSHGQARAAFPFHADRVDAGHGSAATENGRDELWLPFWSRPAGYREIEKLFGEARAQVGRRRARNGLDYVRALGGLGATRGLAGFHRYAIVERAGQSNIAVHTGSYATASAAAKPLDRLRPLDAYIEGYRRLAQGKNAPPRFGRAFRRFQAATLNLARSPGASRELELLAALGGMRREQARGLPDDMHLIWHSPADPAWLSGAGLSAPEGAELRIAVALCCLDHDATLAPLHHYLWPSNNARSVTQDAPRLPLYTLMTAIVADRLRAYRPPSANEDGIHQRPTALPAGGRSLVRSTDLMAALYGDLDAERTLDLLWVLSTFKIGTLRQALEKGHTRAAASAQSLPPQLSRAWMLARIVTEGVVREHGSASVPLRVPGNLLQLLRAGGDHSTRLLLTTMARALLAAGVPVRRGIAGHHHPDVLSLPRDVRARERMCGLLAVPLPHTLLAAFSHNLLAPHIDVPQPQTITNQAP